MDRLLTVGDVYRRRIDPCGAQYKVVRAWQEAHVGPCVEVVQVNTGLPPPSWPSAQAVLPSIFNQADFGSQPHDLEWIRNDDNVEYKGAPPIVVDGQYRMQCAAVDAALEANRKHVQGALNEMLQPPKPVPMTRMLRVGDIVQNIPHLAHHSTSQLYRVKAMRDPGDVDIEVMGSSEVINIAQDSWAWRPENLHLHSSAGFHVSPALIPMSRFLRKGDTFVRLDQPDRIYRVIERDLNIGPCRHLTISSDPAPEFNSWNNTRVCQTYDSDNSFRPSNLALKKHVDIGPGRAIMQDMKLKDIEAKHTAAQRKLDIIFETAKAIRELLDNAKKDFGAEAWDAEDAQTQIDDLVTNDE